MKKRLPGADELRAEVLAAYVQAPSGAWRVARVPSDYHIPPYSTVLHTLMLGRYVMDFTNLQDEMCVRLGVLADGTHPNTGYELMLSVLAPYGALLASDGHSSKRLALSEHSGPLDPTALALARIVEDAGFVVLPQALLGSPLPFSVEGFEPGLPLRVFEALFTNMPGLPWDASSEQEGQ